MHPAGARPVAAVTAEAVAHGAVNATDIRFRRTSGTYRAAIFARKERRLPPRPRRMGSSISCSPTQFSFRRQRRKLGHRMAGQLANAHTDGACPEKRACSPLRASMHDTVYSYRYLRNPMVTPTRTREAVHPLRRSVATCACLATWPTRQVCRPSNFRFLDLGLWYSNRKLIALGGTLVWIS